MNELDNYLKNEIEENKLIKSKHGLYIKKKYIQILKNYGIDISEHSNINDVIFLIDNLLNDMEDIDTEDYELLDSIVLDLQETHYYNETNK